MSFIDNREFIEKLKETGDVVFVDQEVDWDMEMGAIVRRVCEKNLPAPFFQNIKELSWLESAWGSDGDLPKTRGSDGA